MTSTYSVIFPNCGIYTKGETDGEKFANLRVENIIISIVLFHHSYLCVPLHCKKNLKGRKLKFFGGAKAKVVKVENDRCKQRNFSKQTTGSNRIKSCCSCSYTPSDSHIWQRIAAGKKQENVQNCFRLSSLADDGR